MRYIISAFFTLAVAVPTAFPQAVTGTYTIQNPQGPTVTLILTKDALGKIGGSLSGNGASYVVQGEMRGEEVTGTLRDGAGGVYFEAHREGAQLRLIMIEAGADGKPDFSKGRELMFASSSSPQTPANPLARGTVAPAPFAGTFTGAEVVLTMQMAGAAYSGTIRYQGVDYPATARAVGQSAAGTFRVGTQNFEFTLARASDDQHVNLTTGGTTYLLGRDAVVNPLAKGTATSTAVSPTKGATPRDQQLINLLTSSAWCAFSYKGSSTYTGGMGGSTNTTRSVFRADGIAIQSSNHELYNSGAPGSISANNAGGQQGRWKVQNGMLMLSADGVQWTPLPLEITQNSNGYPIIKTDGKEYMMCK